MKNYHELTFFFKMSLKEVNNMYLNPFPEERGGRTLINLGSKYLSTLFIRLLIGHS